MSSSDEWEGIKFTWKMENFSHYKKRMGDVRSPSFGSNSLEWEVIISIENEFICISVVNLICKINRNYRILNLNCSIECLDCNGIPLKWEHRRNVCIAPPFFFKQNIINFGAFIEMNNSNYSNFLPNGTLTIQCRLWRTEQGLTAPVSRFARTRIEPTAKVMKKVFTWNIVGVSSFQPLQSFQRSGTITLGESFTVTLTLLESDKFSFKLETSFTKVYLNIKINFLYASGKRQIANVNHQFEKMKEFHICTDITKKMLMCYANYFLPLDTLSLQFTCTFTANIIFNQMVNEREFMAYFPGITSNIREISGASVCADEPEINQPTSDPPDNITDPPNRPNTVIQTLQEVLNDGLLSDFNLRVGEKVFAVHKLILAMRSQVFRAMFTSEMKEKDNNFVDIPDVDEESLQRLLQFIYSDNIDEDMGWENALNLYAAADKYALEPLKLGCSKILKSELSVSNVLEVLSLADMRQDKDLKSATLEFISLNDQGIVDSELWIKFEEENAKLALDTYRNLYKKKMNA